jgi:ABC-type multidrug transport system ATPase subunit
MAPCMILGLIEPNGAGQTTLCNCLSRLAGATDGVILIVLMLLMPGGFASFLRLMACSLRCDTSAGEVG